MSIERRASYYRRESWLDPRIEVRDSLIRGRGLFATVAIPESEIIIIFGGTLMTAEEIAAGKARKGSIAAVDEELYLAGNADEPPAADDFLNRGAYTLCVQT